MDTVESFKQLCEEKHKNLNESIRRHEEVLTVHDERILFLEKGYTDNAANIKHVCKQISDLTKSIWGLIVTMFTMAGGFIIWYIQNKT